MAAGVAQDLTVSVNAGKVTFAGLASTFTVFDNTKTVAVTTQSGPIPHGALDWQALDGDQICLDASSKEGYLRVDKVPTVAFASGVTTHSVWTVDYIAPG